MYVGRYYGSNTPLQLVHLFLLCICEKSLKIKIEILRGRCDFYLGILLPLLVTVVRNMIWFIVGWNHGWNHPWKCIVIMMMCFRTGLVWGSARFSFALIHCGMLLLDLVVGCFIDCCSFLGLDVDAACICW